MVVDSIENEEKNENSEIINDGLNAYDILCERCKSVILRPKIGKLVKKEIDLPIMKKKNAEDSDNATEHVEDCWLVNQMFAFENIGFSNKVGSIKYLVCADCEIGPVGWHDTDFPNEFYVALCRVVNTS